MMNGISSAGWMQRPDPSQMANRMFSKLDSENKGYLEASDLQSAFSTIGSTDEDGTTAELFKKLDGDGDGKVTESEFGEGFQKLAEQLDSQFHSMRMQGGSMGMMGGMGAMPPPPPVGQDQGFTEEELQAQLNQAEETDSQRTTLLTKLVNNFDEADSDGDGKVSFAEAMAYDNEPSTTQTSASQSSASDDGKLFAQLMKLIQAYGGPANGDNSSLNSSLLSVTA